MALIEKENSITGNFNGSDNGNDEVDSDNSSGEVNGGWAAAISKVLNTTKPKSKKGLVLSRAKKYSPDEDSEKIKERYDFEIDGEIKEEKPDKNVLNKEVKHRKNMPLQLRIKPSFKDIERERTLRKVATRGVVQLFNAVRIQQKELQHELQEAGPLDSRQDSVLNNINKRKFLDVLMSGERAKSEAVDNSIKYELKKEDDAYSDDGNEDDDGQTCSKRKSEWNVFRNDFMTNKKIKHWDEEQESDDTENQMGTASESSDENES